VDFQFLVLTNTGRNWQTWDLHELSRKLPFSTWMRRKPREPLKEQHVIHWEARGLRDIEEGVGISQISGDVRNGHLNLHTENWQQWSRNYSPVQKRKERNHRAMDFIYSLQTADGVQAN
jgi:hypothetical protein